MSCANCKGPLVFDSDKARGWHFFESECIHFLQDRARRVVRVFWRVRVPHLADWVYQGYRKLAWQLAKKMGGKVYRVTVRRVAKVGA